MENSLSHDNPLGGGGTITSFFVLILLIHFNFLHTHQKRKGHLTKILAARKRGQPPSPDATSQGNLLSIVFSVEF